MEQIAQYIFGSVYVLENPEHILKSFASTNEGKRSECKFDGKTFIVTTGKENSRQTLPVFVKILKSYIGRELDPQRDVFEFPQVKRRPSTEWGKSLQDVLAMLDIHDKIGQETEENQLIAHESLKQTWKPLVSGRSVEQMITVDEMREIGNTTSCSVEFEEAIGAITVKGEDEGSLAKAVSKLHVIEASKACYTAYSGTMNFCIDEGDNSFNMRLTPLKILTDRRLLKAMSGRLSRYKEITMVLFDEGNYIPLPRQESLKAISSLLGGSPLWHAYKYKGYGEEVNNVARVPSEPSSATRKVRVHPILPKEKAREVAQWNERAASAKADAFQHIENEGMLNPNLQIPQNDTGSPISKPTVQPRVPIALARTVKGRSIATNNADIDISDSISKEGSVERLPVIRHQDTTIKMFSQDHSAQAQVSNQPHSGLPPPIKPPIIPTDQRTPSASATPVKMTWKLSIEPPSGNLVDTITATLDGTAHRSIAAAQNATNRAYHAKIHALSTSSPVSGTNGSKSKAQSPPLASKQTRVPAMSTTTTKAFAFVSGLMGTGEKPSVKMLSQSQSQQVTETKQAVPESETRRYQRGANLKKLPPVHNPRKDSVLIARIELSCLNFFKIARSVAGKMSLEVCLGKICIDGAHVPKELKTTPFRADNWDSIFHKYNGGLTPTLFTNVLTTSWKDVYHILNLKLSKATRLFCDNQQESSVTYEIQFRNNANMTICTLDLQEDGSFTITKPAEIVGALNWHFIKRTWDARLELTHRAMVRRIEEGYAQAIIRNLYIPEGETIPKLFVKAIPKNITLVSVQVKRRTRHACLTHPNTFLQLTEVQECDIQNNKLGHHRIVGRDPRQLIEDNRLWWEVSVGHVETAKLLQANEGLEIGNYASWGPNVFAERHIIKEMFSVTKNIVTRIDSVGLDTRGLQGVDTRSESSKISRVTSKSRATADEYW